ncbi:unnamed protein product [Ilex paraguariensis]|uniref:Uncharacterized protein n=1 Tax=Ilex paraguariensis TaxID=185542 RepID=A0ABC8TD90_9AQUA
MACPGFHWHHVPLLEIWREKDNGDGNSSIMLESYCPEESVSIFIEALRNNKVNYDGLNIPLPFNLEILKWANETRKVLSCAEVPSQVKFYNIYGTNFETPHSVCCYVAGSLMAQNLWNENIGGHFDISLQEVYGSDDAPVTDLQQLPSLLAKYICVDGDGTVPLESAKVNYDGLNIPLPFNLEILKWANETRKVLSCAEVPSQVKFYNIYGTNFETPHSVCYGSDDAPVTDLQQLPSLLAKYICVDGDGTVPLESAKGIPLKRCVALVTPCLEK